MVQSCPPRRLALFVAFIALFCTQGFALTNPLPNSTYTVSNLSGGLMWDDYANSAQNGALVDLWTPNAGTNQNWIFTALGNGYYEIASVKSGMALNDPAFSQTTGTQLIQWPYGSGSANVEWQITPSRHGYIITNAASGLAVDANGNTKGAYIDQNTSNGSSSQVWTMQAPPPVATGTYTVTNGSSGLAGDDWQQSTSRI